MVAFEDFIANIATDIPSYISLNTILSTRILHLYLTFPFPLWLIHVSKLAYYFKMAHSGFKTCLRFQGLEIVGKLRYNIERQL